MRTIVVAFMLCAAPSLANACPLCISAQDESVQHAYIFATIFMTAMPLLLIGGGVYWLWRRARRMAAEEAAGVIRLSAAQARSRREPGTLDAGS